MSDDVFQAAVEALRLLRPDERKRAIQTIKTERREAEGAIRAELSQLPNSHWSKVHLLKRLPNPTEEGYEQKIHIPEFTFMGVGAQPDFGEVLITFYPSRWTIELKSLKQYKESFRNDVASYERLANVIFEDLTVAYEPLRLRLMMRMRPRGGISSALTIDSDWSIRGGDEQYGDWQTNVDTFGFVVQQAAKV